jgi:hypothetical protein
METPSILIWQILRFDPKDRKLQLELVFEFPFCVIIKAVLRLVFNGGPLRLATLVTAQNTKRFDFFFGSENINLIFENFFAADIQ